MQALKEQAKLGFLKKEKEKKQRKAQKRKAALGPAARSRVLLAVVEKL